MQFHGTRHDALTIARNAVAICVASERHESQFRDTLCAVFGVVIQPSTPMDDQNARTLSTLRVIPGEEPCEYPDRRKLIAECA